MFNKLWNFILNLNKSWIEILKLYADILPKVSLIIIVDCFKEKYKVSNILVFKIIT